MTALTDTQPETQLFRTLEDDIILTVHNLVRPSAEHLFQIHRQTDTYPQGVKHLKDMRRILNELIAREKPLLQQIKPVDPDGDGYFLPHLYRDTNWSRKRLREITNIFPTRLATKITSYYRAHEHDYENSADLVAYTLTSRKYQQPFAYLPHLCEEKGFLYPKVTVEYEDQVAILRPKPDKTVCIWKYLNWHEHDMGHEQIEVGILVRDATIIRKLLVFQKLIDLGFFQKLGYKDRDVFMTFSINSLARKDTSSRKRIKECIDKFPSDLVDPKRVYFGTKQAFDQHEDDLSQMQFMRADGKLMQLPCYRGM